MLRNFKFGVRIIRGSVRIICVDLGGLVMCCVVIGYLVVYFLFLVIYCVVY